MGPYDNDKSEYVFDSEVLEAHWLIHEQTGFLYIVARDDDGFEGYGADDAVLESLYRFSDNQLEDTDVMTAQGFEVVPEVLRRMDPEQGYFPA